MTTFIIHTKIFYHKYVLFNIYISIYINICHHIVLVFVKESSVYSIKFKSIANSLFGYEVIFDYRCNEFKRLLV